MLSVLVVLCGHGQAGGCGVLVVGVVHGHDPVAVRGQDRGADRGAVPAGAVHPDLTGRDLAQAAQQLVQRDVHRAVDVRLVVLGGAAHVQDGHACGGGGPGPGRRTWPARTGPAARRSTAPGRRWPRRRAGRCRSGPAHAGPRRPAPGSHPAASAGCPTGSASPGRSRTGPSRPKLNVPGTCPAANAVRVRRSTSHSPASSRARSAALSAGSGADRSGARRAGGVGRAHLGVVRRPGVQPGQQLRHPRLLVLGQGRVGAPSPARSSRPWPRTGSPSRSCRTRGWAAPAPRPAARRPAGAPRRTGGAPGRGCGPGRAGPGGRSNRTAATRRRTPRPAPRRAASA